MANFCIFCFLDHDHLLFISNLFATKKPNVNITTQRNTNITSKYIKSIGNPEINCPITIINEFPPKDPATTIKDPILLVTLICCFNHKIPHAQMDAIPVPITAEHTKRTSTDSSAAEDKTTIPIPHKEKLNINWYKELIRNAMKTDANLIAAKDPQKAALTLAACCLER